MKYIGGKYRLAARLVRTMLADCGKPRLQHSLELCAGGGNMTVRLADVSGHVTAVESHVGLVELHRKVQEGWVPPHDITREQHAAATNPDDPEHTFARLSRSFGGYWGGGFCPDEAARVYDTFSDGKWRTKRVQPQSPVRTASRSLVKARRDNVTWLAGDALSVVPPEGVDLVYVDPPYEGTFGYEFAPPAQVGAWWRRCAELASILGIPVYMSEAQGPPPGIVARCVMQHKLGQRRLHAGEGKERVEMLWRF